MAQPISKRLSKLNYQIKKSIVGGFTDSQLIEKVQSIYDAAINSTNEADIALITLPTTIFGTVQLFWSDNNTTVSITQGSAAVVDSLVDEEVPQVDEDTSNYLEVNSELFTVNGDYLLVA